MTNQVIALPYPTPTLTMTKFKKTTRISNIQPEESIRMQLQETYHLKMTKRKNHMSSYQRRYWMKKKLTLKKRNTYLSQDTNVIIKDVVKITYMIQKQRRYWMLSGDQKIKSTKNGREFTQRKHCRKNLQQRSRTPNQRI